MVRQQGSCKSLGASSQTPDSTGIRLVNDLSREVVSNQAIRPPTLVLEQSRTTMGRASTEDTVDALNGFVLTFEEYRASTHRATGVVANPVPAAGANIDARAGLCETQVMSAPLVLNTAHGR